MTLRQVCKHWRSLADQIYPKELVIENCSLIKLGRKALVMDRKVWFHTGRLIQNDSILRKVTNFELIKFRLEELRCLAIYDCLSNKTNSQALFLNTLSQFVKLKHLEVSNFNLSTVGYLKLPNLRTFSLSSIDSSGRPLNVDAPKLKIISCLAGLRYLYLSYPEKVKELRVHSKDHRLGRFAKVKVLRFDRPDSIDPKILNHLPVLKRLHFEEDKFDSTDYEQIKSTMDAVLQNKKVVKNELKVFFLDTPLDKAGQTFDDYRLFLKYFIFGTSADHKLELDAFVGLNDLDETDNFEVLDDSGDNDLSIIE